MRARIGISGSSTSANSRSTPSSRERLLERRPDGERRQRLEARGRDGRQARGRRRQHEVEPLRDDVGDLLGPQRGVDEVGGDLGVEVDGERRGASGSSANRAVSSGFTSCPTRRASTASRSWRRAIEASTPSAATTRPSSPATASDSGAPGERPRVVDDEAGPDRLAVTEPRLERRDAVRVHDLDPPRVHDRGRERAGQVAGRGRERLGTRLDRRRGRGDRRRRSAFAGRRRRHRPTRRRSPSTAGAAPGSTGPPRPPPARPTPWAAGNPASRSARIAATASSGRSPTRGGSRSISVRNSNSRNSRTTSWRSYSPTRPRVGSRVDVDVAHEPHQLAALEHGLAVLLERGAQLLRGDLVDVLVQGVERAPRRDQLRGGLLADPGDARDVVGRIALERLVVEHLVGPQAPPLLDLREVVGDRVRDAATQRDHELRVLADELEHVEVAGEDRGVEPEALGLPDERGDGVVGLEPLLLVLGDVQGAHDLLHLGDLLAHVVGHARPGGLVLGVAVVAERAGRAGRRRSRPGRAARPGSPAGRCS